MMGSDGQKSAKKREPAPVLKPPTCTFFERATGLEPATLTLAKKRT